MFTGLAVFRDTSFKFSCTGGNNEHCTVSLEREGGEEGEGLDLWISSTSHNATINPEEVQLVSTHSTGYELTKEQCLLIALEATESWYQIPTQWVIIQQNVAPTHLGSPCNHVLDEIPVTRCIDDCHVIFSGFELPQGNVDGDTTLTFSLQLVQHPSILERPLPHLVQKAEKHIK